MNKYLLDTTIIIDCLRDRKGRPAYLQRLLAEGHLLGCCAINVAEVYAGMRNHEKATTDELIESLDYFPITREAARLAGQFKREYAQKGITISIADAIIAATAQVHNLILLTDNLDYFPMIKGA